MGDVSPTDTRHSLTNSTEKVYLHEQGESKANGQTQPWAPLPTAFDTIEPKPGVSEYETPTRPVTPSQISAGDNHQPPPNGGAHLKAKTHSKSSGVRAQGKSECAVCGVDLTTTKRSERLDHFNHCWSRVRKLILTANSRSKENLPVEAQSPSSVCILCNANLDDLSSVDAFEHRVLCFRSQRSIPAACPKCGIPFVVSQSHAMIAEHLYGCSVRPKDEIFDAVQDAWCKRRNERKQRDNCPFCSKILKCLDSVDALSHRNICLGRRKLEHCPICLEGLPPLTARSLQRECLWHVRNCQHNKSLSDIDRNVQKKLETRVTARVWVVCHLFGYEVSVEHMIGPRKGWGSKHHSQSYIRKRKAGRKATSGMYSIPHSSLRTVTTYAEDESTELVQMAKNSTGTCSSLDIFCRSAYCVYSIPKHRKNVVRTRNEQEIYDNVRGCHNRPDISRDLSSSTRDLSLNDRRDQRCSGTQTTASNRASTVSFCEGRRRSAVEAARTKGMRIPPGFELETNDSDDTPAVDSDPTACKSRTVSDL